MRYRKLAVAFTFTVGVAGVANSHAEDARGSRSAADAPTDPVVASFERALDRQPGPAVASSGRAIESDVLYVLVNRPLQTPAGKPVAVTAGKGE